MGYTSTLDLENEQGEEYMSCNNTPTTDDYYSPAVVVATAPATADDDQDNEDDDDDNVMLFMDPSMESYAMQYVFDTEDTSVILWRNDEDSNNHQVSSDSMSVSAEKFKSEVLTIKTAYEWSRLAPFVKAGPFTGEDYI